MDNVELSRPTRWGMVATGLLQGLASYLLISWLAPIDRNWIFYGLPITLAISSLLLFSVVSFTQKQLWGWLAIVSVAVLAMSGWLKWKIIGMEEWRADEVFWCYGGYLLLMAMLALPWIQQHLHPQPHLARYARFYALAWQNTLTLFVILTANALVWLVLSLWAALFELIGITSFSTLFFETDGFIYIAIGLITALAVILARTQLRLVGAMQKLLTLIATGLLPLVSLLTLLFVATLPFTGITSISRHISAAGLLSTLAFLLLLLMAIVRDPQKSSLPYTGALRCLIKTSLLVVPIYVLIAAWALWVRVSQYGWTPDRLHGALVVAVLLVWSLGYFISIVRRKASDPLILQGKVNLAVSLLTLVILLLLNSPVLDSWRISVNSHMARYHSGKIKADDITLYLLERSGRPGRAALESLKNDAGFMQDARRKQSLMMILNGNRQDRSEQLSAKVLASNVLVVPGMAKPDNAFWSVVERDRYQLMSCDVKDACVLINQDLNNDGQPERILLAFGDSYSLLYSYDAEKKVWGKKGRVPLLKKITKEDVLQAIESGKIGAKPKAWRDLTIGDETLEIDY